MIKYTPEHARLRGKLENLEEQIRIRNRDIQHSRDRITQELNNIEHNIRERSRLELEAKELSVKVVEMEKS